MSIRFIDDDENRSSGSNIVSRYLAEKYIEELKKKEDDAKKAKEKNKGPKTVSVAYCVLLLTAAAPFVGMFMSWLLLNMYVNWAAAMKALVNQL